ncbi:hypothetical protein KQI89_10835 [Clostridium sp. MSJ-4]|uniref:STAS domain-containing protein n=1 Tax=Clostridium simiarum TaxID=2841506 RepID=A0ABS6F187_9CLOT|nr:hypothetical protein [Clostridium simiarum]MBU5592258.1 hypothetical protein [Clostridium simiarum]
MYTIRYDNSKNCIYILVEGNMDLQQADNYVKDLKRTIDGAKANFNMCTDLSKASVVLPEVNEKLNETKAYAKKKGYNKCAFVVSSAVFKMQIRRVFEESQESLFTSITDAEKFLNS